MEDEVFNTDNSVARSISMREPGPGEGDPSLADELRRRQKEFLESQIELQGLQADKLKTELLHQHIELKIAAVSNVRERLKLVLDVGLAFLGLALIALIGAAIYSATRSQSVVVDAFSVPPDFAAQGNTGVVVAGGFLDRLTTLQNATRADATHHSIEDAWSNDVKIDIPETGVSLGEVLTYL
ncbi:MAG TPA: hypothetical protein VMD53_07130, partial [Rhizomicrobium sp.]|nr:hypothetical protein [Rhizomicrobium sp.]